MEVYIRGTKNKINLNKNDFVTKGGEASIFIRQGLVFKIYHDSKNMIKEAKIQELNALNTPNIVRPLDILLDSKNKPVGFTMAEIKNAVPLCKLFTNDFWNRNGITSGKIKTITDEIRKTISFIHERDGYLIVDGNEFNYLIDQNFKIPYFIDVDSYQTPSYSATAIMPSIQDYHSNSFSCLTDWYAFGIVSFQLFAGIHPYKGRHPDFKRNDLEGRMRSNISVFNNKTSLPSAVRNLDTAIPKNYRFWYLEIFENGIRTNPPEFAGDITIITVPISLVGNADDFIIKEIAKFKSDILYYNKIAGNEVVKLRDNSLYINSKQYLFRGEVIFSPKTRTPHFVGINNNYLQIHGQATGKSIIKNPVFAENIMVINDHIYIKSMDKIVEIAINETTIDNCVPYVKMSMNILPKATTFFSNVIYQNILGVPHFNIPQPSETGHSSMFTVQTKELDGYKIIDAKYLNRVLVVTTHRNNQYHRFIFRFTENHNEYNVRKIEDILYCGINFAVMDNGVVVIIQPDDSLEAMINDPNNTKIRRFENVDSNMKLHSVGNKIFFTKSNKLFSLSIKT